jgi:hypothetical protein
VYELIAFDHLSYLLAPPRLGGVARSPICGKPLSARKWEPGGEVAEKEGESFSHPWSSPRKQVLYFSQKIFGKFGVEPVNSAGKGIVSVLA